MAVRYSHSLTNRNFGVLLLALAAVLAGTWYMQPRADGWGAAAMVALAIAAAALPVFSTLNVEVDEQAHALTRPRGPHPLTPRGRPACSWRYPQTLTGRRWTRPQRSMTS